MPPVPTYASLAERPRSVVLRLGITVIGLVLVVIGFLVPEVGAWRIPLLVAGGLAVVSGYVLTIVRSRRLVRRIRAQQDER